MERPERSGEPSTSDADRSTVTRILLIAGWGRSGSTILANALGSAPGVVTLGEINNVWERGFGDDLQCSCGEPFHACPGWRPIAERAFDADSPAVLARARAAASGLGNTWLIRRTLPFVGKGQKARGNAYAELLSALYTAAAEHTGAKLLVDASKSPWHCAIAASLPGFEVTVLHLIRDPRGVAHSLRKKVDYQTAGAKIHMDRHGPSASSFAWVYRNRLVEWEWRNSDRYLQMRYEDFMANPRAAIARIMKRVGMPGVSPRFTGPSEVEITPSHNISGNPVRFQKGAVSLRSDEEWRHALPRLTQGYVRLVTWPHMSHFGYS